MQDQLALRDIVLLWRTFDACRRIFAIDGLRPAAETIPDVASGAPPFCAEANEKGFHVTAASDRLVIADYSQQRQKRHAAADYPVTSLEDNQCDISLVSHCLFLYEDHLDYNFHRQSPQELVRIMSEEIRAFPVVKDGSGLNA